MKNFCFLILLFLGVVMSGCRRDAESEKEEEALVDKQLAQPAYQVLYKTGKPGPALAVFDSLAKKRRLTSPLIAVSRFGLLANYHFFLTRDFNATGRYVDSALAVLQTPEQASRYPRTEVYFLLFGGEIAFRLGNYTRSNNYFFAAKQGADQYLDPCERTGFTYNAAMVSYRQENFSQAAAYFKDAFATQATCAVQTRAVVLQQQEIISNIGLCLYELKEYDSALHYFQETMAYAERNRDSLGPVFMEKIRGVEWGNMAKIYTARNRFSEAETLFKQSIAMNSQPGHEELDALENQGRLAELYASQKRREDEWQQLVSMRKGLDTLKDRTQEANWLRLMAGYYGNGRQPLEELSYVKRYATFRDSISESQKRLAQADISRQLKEKEQAMQIALLTKDNRLNQFCLWAAVFITCLAGVIIFLVNQDYRRSKQNIASLTLLNRKISLQKQALEKANLEKDRILHVVAHDLRNPIGIAAYVSDMVMMEAQTERDKASLQMIKEASQKALSLTNELLGLKNPKGKNNENFVMLVRKSVELQRVKAAEKDQQIFLDLPNEKVFVEGETDQLVRVVDNLLANAVKFSPVLGKIFVKLETTQRHALLQVTDQGVGIPEELLEEVFIPFTPVRRRGTLGEASIGLGLSICREIVDSQGGSIDLESIENEGTTFSVRLPLAQDV